jgi:hypothetical protein
MAVLSDSVGLDLGSVCVTCGYPAAKMIIGTEEVASHLGKPEK